VGWNFAGQWEEYWARLAYTMHFDDAVYVLHCFQKKSPSGSRTARTDVETIHRRLRAARADCEVRYGKKT
jgi:phage-related protein